MKKRRISIKQKKQEGWPEPPPWSPEWVRWQEGDVVLDFHKWMDKARNRVALKEWDNETTRLFSGI